METEARNYDRETNATPNIMAIQGDANALNNFIKSQSDVQIDPGQGMSRQKSSGKLQISGP